MATATKRTRAPKRDFSSDELQQAARELVARASGLAQADFKRELPADIKTYDKQVLAAANELAARRELFRWSVAKKVRFFTRDPFELLGSTVSAALSDGPLTELELKSRVEAAQRGLGDLLKEWLKGALTRGDVFPQGVKKGQKGKRFGKYPDLEDILKKVTSELTKTLSSPIGQRIPKSMLLEFIAGKLGLSLSARGSTTHSGHSTSATDTASASDPASASLSVAPTDHPLAEFMARLAALLQDTKSDGLLSLRELRKRLPCDKRRFDAMALELARMDLVTLHHHDFPTSLAESDRNELVSDEQGNYFIGIALRRAQ